MLSAELILHQQPGQKLRGEIVVVYIAATPFISVDLYCGPSAVALLASDPREVAALFRKLAERAERKG